MLQAKRGGGGALFCWGKNGFRMVCGVDGFGLSGACCLMLFETLGLLIRKCLFGISGMVPEFQGSRLSLFRVLHRWRGRLSLMLLWFVASEAYSDPKCVGRRPSEAFYSRSSMAC